MIAVWIVEEDIVTWNVMTTDSLGARFPNGIPFSGFALGWLIPLIVTLPVMKIVSTGTVSMARRSSIVTLPLLVIVIVYVKVWLGNAFVALTDFMATTLSFWTVVVTVFVVVVFVTGKLFGLTI